MAETGAKIYQRDPLMHYTKRMSDAYGEWQRVGDYAIWTGHVPAGEENFTLLEIVGGKIAEVKKEGRIPLLHVVRAGVPHHVTHMFGFWHVSDSDVIWIHSPREEADYYMMIIGGVQGIPGESTILWYCHQCLEELPGAVSVKLQEDFSPFTDFQLTAVRKFNGSLDARTCSKCQTVHPLAFGFYPDADTEDERAARKDW